MDQLTKQQVVLICLLIAIVTSITTGIVTISLSDQSPGGVPQTIYQVVERTIEKVVPDSSPVKKIIEKDTTVKELPLTDIVDRVSKNIIRIYRKDASGASQFISIAVAVGDKGTLFAPEGANPTVEGESLNAVLPDGTEMEVNVVKKNIFAGTDALLIKDSKNNSKTAKTVLGGFADVKLGTNLVAFGGKENNNVVSTGIISEFQNGAGDNATTTAKTIAVTNISLSNSTLGWMLLNTSGKTIGFVLPIEAGLPAKYLDASVAGKSAGPLI